ncbi:TPA: cell filamentation protein Fic [Candidatus Delongbacteria bacterium]|nr:cell filamentation protein Fic [Candidatus Delongbacteria bacterium]
MKKNELSKIGEKIVLFSNSKGNVTATVYFEDDNFWLTQKAMSELFDVSVKTINEHLKNVYTSGELKEEATIRNFRIVQKEGERNVEREVAFYNLDAIISIGYRVNSIKATEFRIWATNTLKEFIVKGFVLNDEQMKNGKSFGKDYFDELLERIREIRASERRAYQKIADVFEQCSADYRKDAEETKMFYAFVQNKLHYAVTGKTAAEIIFERANSNKPTMGLTTWKNSPSGKILKNDIKVAKNYLNQTEISKLNRLTAMFIDFAEIRALNQQVMEMKDWIQWMNRFLQFSDQQILETAGKITQEMAQLKAEEEYLKFSKIQDRDYISEFDKEFAKYLKGNEDE